MALNDSKAYSVLLVEDTSADTERMQFLLEEDSIVFNIKTVLPMREAILELKEQTFDLSLLDISLLDSVGIRTLKKNTRNLFDYPDYSYYWFR